MQGKEKIAVCQAVTQLVLADGQVRDAEWELLDRLAERLGLSPEERKRARQADAGGDARRLLADLGDEARATLLDELAAAAVVDGELGKSERQILTEVAEALGQDQAAVEAALTKARG
ncbi:MAG TPA: TerB family tellurite resistance protein [Myxococcota bacterium]|nr:TerB family tellurite resistance protein [Myxococcota bacterium]HRY94211.1 TerB family tellurite resistance protein [Myxococcota bacterium]HSA20103.1 TerB family tellurite resistance protein [Myxococcota bacterium]